MNNRATQLGFYHPLRGLMTQFRYSSILCRSIYLAVFFAGTFLLLFWSTSVNASSSLLYQVSNNMGADWKFEVTGVHREFGDPLYNESPHAILKTPIEFEEYYSVYWEPGEKSGVTICIKVYNKNAKDEVGTFAFMFGYYKTDDGQHVGGVSNILISVWDFTTCDWIVLNKGDKAYTGEIWNEHFRHRQAKIYITADYYRASPKNVVFWDLS